MKLTSFLTAALSICVSFSSVAHAQNSKELLDVSGFSKSSEDATSCTYQFRDEDQYVVSKEKFQTIEAAKSFCSHYSNHHLAKPEEVLLIAMSGTDHNIRNAIIFKYGEPFNKSGLVAWINADKDQSVTKGADIFMMYDGEGTDTDALNLAELNKGLSKANINLKKKVALLQLNAICVENLKPQEDK